MLTALVIAAFLPLQTGSTALEPGQPLVLSWYHDGAKGPKFRVWQNGKIVLNATSDHYVTVPAALTNCLVDATACFEYTLKPTALAPLMTPGSYVFEVSAFNEFGEAPKSEPITVTVGWSSAPAVPRGLILRKVELLPDGTWRFK